jgi:integrase
MTDTFARALSAKQVEQFKPRAETWRTADGGGLYLQIEPNGSKLWRYKYRLAGTEKRYSIGEYPAVSLAAARNEHREARELVRQGINPTQHRDDRKKQTAADALERNAGSFHSVWTAWNAATSPDLRQSTIAQRKREVEKDLFPKLRSRPLKSISRLELTALLREVEARAPEVARNLRNHLYGIFEYAIDSGLMEQNPAPPVRIMTRRNQQQHAALTPKRMAEFVKAVRGANMEPYTRIAMLLVLLTACRKSEVIEARWSEFDMDAEEWVIPKERMKAGREHWVPLSRQAVALVRELREITPADREFLFPNRRDPLRPMANRSLNAVFERLGFAGEGTPHGMRAQFSTHFNSRGESVDVIERCLAHVPKDAVRAAYNRHEYREERRAMLQAWSDHVHSNQL